MRLIKGSVQFYIVSFLLVLISGVVVTLVYTEVTYGILSNQGNSACTLSNAFKNLYTDDGLFEQSLDEGNSNCIPTSKTLRSPDITTPSRLFDTCKELQNNYDSVDQALSDPFFSDKCLSYSLLNEAKSCWFNYLKGNAKFSGECSRICISDSFRSYKLIDSEGSFNIQNSLDSEFKLSDKKIIQEKLLISEISGLRDIKESNIEINIQKSGDESLITYEKDLSSDESPFLIDINNPELGVTSIYSALEIHSMNPNFPVSNILLPENLQDNPIKSGDQIVVGFVESTDIDLLANLVLISSPFIGGKALTKGVAITTAAGASVVVSELFDFSDVELDSSYIYFDRRGSC